MYGEGGGRLREYERESVVRHRDETRVVWKRAKELFWKLKKKDGGKPKALFGTSVMTRRDGGETR
jgi:hypothetical protein